MRAVTHWTPAEKSADPEFQRRLARLIGVSLIALGLITILAWTRTEADNATITLLAAGWILMPTLLYLGIQSPGWRYLLAVPATLVTVGLIRVIVRLDASTTASVGWWLITVGVVIGGSLGAWFWYRWIPVPVRLDDPFSPARWMLIGIHAGMIVVGMVLVLVG